MFDIQESDQLYLQAMLERAQLMAEKIKGYLFVSNAYVEGEGIQVVFTEEVEIGDQDVLDLFLRGGAIKKANSKDNDDNFILVEPIGEF